MNRIATKPSRRRSPPKIPHVVAHLDPADERQHKLRVFFLRMHGGRFPTLRTLTLRQRTDGAIVEAAEWLRGNPTRYSVITWLFDDDGISWFCRPMPSRRAAIAAAREMAETSP